MIFPQFNWQTDSLIEIDNVVNGEKNLIEKKRSFQWNIHAVLLVRRCLSRVNQRNFVTRWNFISNLLASRCWKFESLEIEGKFPLGSQLLIKSVKRVENEETVFSYFWFFLNKVTFILVKPNFHDFSPFNKKTNNKKTTFRWDFLPREKSINFSDKFWVTFYGFYGRENGDEEPKNFSFMFNQKQRKYNFSCLYTTFSRHDMKRWFARKKIHFKGFCLRLRVIPWWA